MTPQEKLDQALQDEADSMGVPALLQLPGVWEIVAEELNNAAIKRLGGSCTWCPDEAFCVADFPKGYRLCDCCGLETIEDHLCGDCDNCGCEPDAPFCQPDEHESVVVVTNGGS